jgi:hypothetical protein
MRLKKTKTTLFKKIYAQHQWLMPIILTPEEGEIRRITVQGQPGQIVHETPSPK